MKALYFKNDGTLDTDYIDIEIGQEVTVYRCSGGHSVFGEPAKLHRVNSNHLVFVTESGAEVKTAIDNLFDIRGKAAKAGYGVSLRKFSDFDGIYHEHIGYWNSKKGCFDKK